MPSDELFSREEVLGGLPARQAHTLLFLIESRTAHLVAQSRRAMEIFLTEQAAEERDLAFFEAFSLGRQPPLRPTIQDLERYAPQWASLVPDNPRLQAAIAHILGEKYDFTYPAVPGIRAALGADEEAVQQAYHRLYREPLETIFASRTPLPDRLRWTWTALAEWLESLSPFWTAFALTLTEIVAESILALPIAVAGIGPLAGIVVLVVLGVVNVLTIASLAEAVSRSGTIRYGSGFIGRLVSDYLGSAGSLILTLAVATICFAHLVAYYIGVSTTLADATHVSAAVWTGLLFLIGLYFLSREARESIHSTVASSLLVGGINIGLILILSILAFPHVRSANLLYMEVPFLGGHHFEPELVETLFGVIIVGYLGHLSVGSSARVVLRRDPSARALIWGSMAAEVVVIGLYSIWVLAINGAVASEVLVHESGTALVPLAEQVGPSVLWLGSALVILGMGMASIHYSVGLFNLVRERLPRQHRPIVMLPHKHGKLLFHRRSKPSGSPRIGLTYLGLDDTQSQPQFRLDVQLGGNTHHLETTVADHWQITELFDRLPELRQHRVRLTLGILDANPESVRLRIHSPMHLTYEGNWDVIGLNMADLLTLPDSLRRLVNWIMRQGDVNLAQVVAHTGGDEASTRTMLETLIEQGFVREVSVEGENEVRYRARLAPKRRRQLSQEIWQALDETVEVPAGARVGSVRLWEGMRVLAQRIWEVLGERGRFLLSVSPMMIVFVVTEWLLLNHVESFVEALEFAGVIPASLFAGIFPVLLLFASRRKSEFVLSGVFRFLGHPWFIASIYLLILASLLFHGLIIWHNPVERASALIAAILVLGVTIAMVRRGAFASRMVVELREELSEDGEGQAVFSITADGQPTATQVRLGYPDGEQQYRTAIGEVPEFASLRYAAFHLPEDQAHELKVWVHAVTPEGESEGLPALLDLHCGNETTRFDLRLSGGQVVLPATNKACQLEITFSELSRS
ncbi:MAG: helix-turn-helix domain-containing protein [Candidatus Bipolaricaulia bacterium]